MADNEVTQSKVDDVFNHGWKTPPTLSDLKTDFDMTTSSHSAHVARVTNWLNALRPDSGSVEDNSGGSYPFSQNYSLKETKVRSTVKSKLIRKQAEWRYTSLSEPFLNTPDIFNVDPRRKSDVDAARQNQLVLNKQINTELNKVAFIDEYVRTCVDEGTVIVKVGWDYQTNTVTNEYPVFSILPITSPEELEILQEMSQLPPDQLQPEILEALKQSQVTGIPHFPTQTGVEEIEEEQVVVNKPSWEVCDYNNIRIDPTCYGVLEDASFIIYSFETSKSSLEKTGLYSNLDKIIHSKVSSTSEHNSQWATTGFEFQDDSRKKLIVHEYWGYWDVNGTGKTKPMVASWVGEVLIRLEDSPFADGELPFVAVPFMPLKKEIVGEPDGELLKDNQDIASAITRGMIDLLGKSANSQTGFRKGALDAVNKRRYDLGKDYDFNDVGDAQQSIYMHKYPEIPASAYNFLQMQQQEGEALTGVIPFSSTTAAGLGNTAAAANGALSATARRELGILRRLSEGLKKIASKFISMNQEFLSEEETVRITEAEFVKFSRDDLAGKFDLRITVSTAEADEQKAAELSFMLQTTSATLGSEFTSLILAEIAELRKMPLLADKIRNYAPQPDPMAIEDKKLDLAIKQAEIAKLSAETAKIVAEAKATGYKADNTQADTDRKNLDYINEESGISHARDLDRLDRQSEAQAKTKVVSAVLDAAKQSE